MSNNLNTLNENNIIRFFRYKSDFYVLYTNNERTTDNLIKCYASKLIKNENTFDGESLNKDEFKEFEKILLEILKSNKDNSKIPSIINDIDFTNDVKLNIKTSTEINYIEGLIDLLSKNKRTLDYYSLYLNEVKKSKKLQKQTDLQNKEIDELENDIKYYVDTVMKQQGC